MLVTSFGSTFPGLSRRCGPSLSISSKSATLWLLGLEPLLLAPCCSLTCFLGPEYARFGKIMVCGAVFCGLFRCVSVVVVRWASIGGFEKFVTTFNPAKRALFGDFPCMHRVLSFEGFCIENLRREGELFAGPTLPCDTFLGEAGLLYCIFGEAGDRTSTPIGDEKGIRGSCDVGCK